MVTLYLYWDVLHISPFRMLRVHPTVIITTATPRHCTANNLAWSGLNNKTLLITSGKTWHQKQPAHTRSSFQSGKKNPRKHEHIEINNKKNAIRDMKNLRKMLNQKVKSNRCSFEYRTAGSKELLGVE